MCLAWYLEYLLEHGILDMCGVLGGEKERWLYESE